MPKDQLATNRGFSLIEVIIALSIFALIVTIFAGTMLFGQESTATSGSRARAVVLAEEGLEGTRNIRDAAFANLTNGNHGLAIVGNQWVFSGSSDITDIFTRQITISTVDASRKLVVSTVTWQQTPSRQGSVTLTTYLTNWEPF